MGCGLGGGWLLSIVSLVANVVDFGEICLVDFMSCCFFFSVILDARLCLAWRFSHFSCCSLLAWSGC